MGREGKKEVVEGTCSRLVVDVRESLGNRLSSAGAGTPEPGGKDLISLTLKGVGSWYEWGSLRREYLHAEKEEEKKGRNYRKQIYVCAVRRKKKGLSRGGGEISGYATIRDWSF